MGTENVTQYNKRVRLAFLAVAIALPLQFYVVYTQGNLYPALFLPAFNSVLDNGEYMHLEIRKLYAVAGTGQRTEVSYKNVFNNLTEYHGRHTMDRLFVPQAGTEYATLDNKTKLWLYERLITITGEKEVVQFEIDYYDYSFDKKYPDTPVITPIKTIRVNLND